MQTDRGSVALEDRWSRRISGVKGSVELEDRSNQRSRRIVFVEAEDRWVQTVEDQLSWRIGDVDDVGGLVESEEPWNRKTTRGVRGSYWWRRINEAASDSSHQCMFTGVGFSMESDLLGGLVEDKIQWRLRFGCDGSLVEMEVQWSWSFNRVRLGGLVPAKEEAEDHTAKRGERSVD